MLKSCIISGIAGRSIVSEKKTVRRVLLSNARVIHALRLIVIVFPEPAPALPSLGLSLFCVCSGLSILRILIVRGLALFIVNGNRAPNRRHKPYLVVQTTTVKRQRPLALGMYTYFQIPPLLIESENQQPKVVGAPVISMVPLTSDDFLICLTSIFGS